MAVSIRYWEKESWVNYFKNDVLPLYSSAITITGLWRWLGEKVHGRLLSEVVRERPSLEQMFVGGTSPPDKYEEGSLALAYKTLLGVSVKLREYYFLRKLGKEPKTLCTVEKTAILDYIDRIAVLLERAISHACELDVLSRSELKNAQEGSEKAVEEVLREPPKGPERFIEFLDKAANFTIAYNEYTRFIWYLRKVAKKYVKELYPELMKPEVFKFVREFLGLREYIVPQIDDKEIADLYTIFSYDHEVEVRGVRESRYGGVDAIDVIDGMPFSGYAAYAFFTGWWLPPTHEPYNTVGGCLCRVNELIWGLFDHWGSVLKPFIGEEAPNPFKVWKEATMNVPTSKSIPSMLEYPNNYEALSILDELIPSIMVGRLELMKGDGRLIVVSRW